MPSRGGGKGQLLVLHMQISPGTTSAMQASQNAVDFQGKGVLLSLLFLCCSHLRSAFWLSSPSNVFTIPRPPPPFRWFSRIWTSKEGSGDRGGVEECIKYDENVKQVAHKWLPSTSEDLFVRGIHTLPKRWNACVTFCRDYVEKRWVSILFIISVFQFFVWLSLI